MLLDEQGNVQFFYLGCVLKKGNLLPGKGAMKGIPTKF